MIPILQEWAHSKHFHEINKLTINFINNLNHDDAIEALKELKNCHTFIWGTKGQKLSITTTITALDTNAEYKANALIDCGCKGSCIGQQYIQQHNFNVWKLARPIPVYNANGTPNADGAIEEFIAL